LYLILLHRDGARAETYGGAHGDPSPPIPRQIWGWGDKKRERTRSARSRDLLCHRAALTRDRIRAEREGDPQVSSAERCARLVYSCPMPRLDSKYTWITHLFYA